MKIKIHNNDIVDIFNHYDDNHFDIIFSDPPYNLNTKWIIDISGKYTVKGSATDFLSKWSGLTGDYMDRMFKEAYRTMKHGAFFVFYCASRQVQPFYYYAIKNGFEVMEPIYWFYIFSMPKSVDVVKALAKKNIKSDLSGYKYSQTPLKQVMDIVVVLRKPCLDNPLNDILKRSIDIHPSCVNIDENRVPFISEEDKNGFGGKQTRTDDKILNDLNCGLGNGYQTEANDLGRYPSQLYIQSGTEEIIDKQSGIRKGGGSINSRPLHHYGFKETQKEAGIINYSGCSDIGGASRVLHKCSYTEDDFDKIIFNSKTSQGEKHEACENSHPCVKPIELNYKILKLFKLPENYEETIFIPFSGSGSEIIGAIKAGYKNIVAGEINKEYIAISEKRIRYFIKK